MTKLQEARARVAELEAAIDAEKAALQAAEAALVPARKRKAALRARHAKTLLLTQAGGQPNSDGGGIAPITLAMLHPAYGQGVNGKKPAKVAELLANGEAKMQAIGGIAYSLRGFLQRTRRVDKAIMKPVLAAERRRRRAQLALREAWKAERQAYADAYEAGEKLMVSAVAAELAKRFVIPDGEPSIEQSIRDKAWQARRDLPAAQQHLAWVKASNPDKGVCPCSWCAADRSDAIRARDEAARIAELPSVMFECPQCGRRHRGATEIRKVRDNQLNAELRTVLDEKAPGWQQLVDDDRWYPNFELDRVYCAKSSTWFLWTTGIAKRVAKAQKGKARASSKLVEWTCPNPDCGEPNRTVITTDGSLYCEVCEVAFDASTLATRKVKAA